MLRRVIMTAITLIDAVRILSPMLEKDDDLRKDYDKIVKVLGLLYENEDIEKAFQLNLSEEEVFEYARKVLTDCQLTIDDIFIKITADTPKTLCIKANAHFDPDENYSLANLENSIRRKISIFTGYKVNINL